MVLTLVLALAFMPYIQTGSLSEVRIEYEQCEASEEKTKALYHYLEQVYQQSNTLKAYLGATETILAKHVWSPYEKLKLFNQGKAILENTLQTEPNNIEIRYLRLTIQTAAPVFLQYNTAIDTDKRFILSRLKSITDSDLKNRIIKFLLLRGNLTNEERKMLQ